MVQITRMRCNICMPCLFFYAIFCRVIIKIERSNAAPEHTAVIAQEVSCEAHEAIFISNYKYLRLVTFLSAMKTNVNTDCTEENGLAEGNVGRMILTLIL